MSGFVLILPILSVQSILSAVFLPSTPAGADLVFRPVGP